jgi:integrase
MPQNRKTRKRIAEGIYQDVLADGSIGGYEAVVVVGGRKTRRQKSKRFERGTGIRDMAAWQTSARAALQCRRPAKKGAFTADAERYLKQVEHLAGFVSRRSEVRAWQALYGDRSRGSLTAEHIRDARIVWQKDRFAPKTINNRVHTLMNLFHVLDGKRAPTPCDEIKDLFVPKTVPQVVSAETILAVDAELQTRERIGVIRSPKARARFRVFVSSGKRPSEIMRAEQQDVDLERRVWIVRDGKGGFSPGVYLNDDMLAAWRLFVEADAFGYFNEGSWVRTLRSAGWPKNVRPYMARHSVGMLMSDAGVDLADIQAHMGHKRISTTRNTYVPVRGTRLQRASELLNGRLPWRDQNGNPDGTEGTATSPPAVSNSPRGALAYSPRAGNPDTPSRASASRTARPLTRASGRARVLGIARDSDGDSASHPETRRPSSYGSADQAHSRSVARTVSR